MFTFAALGQDIEKMTWSGEEVALFGGEVWGMYNYLVVS